MATIARWGDITFRVNSEQVFSFRKMKRSYSARWAAHNIPGERPIMEFQGPNMDEISIEVILDAEMGVNPRAAMRMFRTAAKQGKVHYFYVGGSKVVARKLYISAGTENWNEIWSGGELVRATATLTFNEYR